MESKLTPEVLNYPLQAIYKKSGKMIFKGSCGYLAYEEGPFSFVVAGDPAVKSPLDFQILMDQFIVWAKSKNKSVCGYYFSEKFKHHTNYKAIKAGTSGLLNLKNFNLKGKSRASHRRALNYGIHKQYSFKEIKHAQKAQYYSQIKQTENKWLITRKRLKIGFLLSPVNIKFEQSPEERWFIVENKQGSIGAFVSVFCFDNNNSVYIDQMIFNPDGGRMSLDFLLAQLILLLQTEGFITLSFGFNAFKLKDPKGLYERAISVLWKLPILYNSKGVYSFKSKYFDFEVPRYIMFGDCSHPVKQILSLVAVTFSNH